MTRENGPVSVKLKDGTTLFFRYNKIVSSHKVFLGPMEEWIRTPDGTERRGSHLSAMMLQD
jgi:hypothetical protein